MNIERIHRAGADFALSIGRVARPLASRMLGERSIKISPACGWSASAAHALAGGALPRTSTFQPALVAVTVEAGDDPHGRDFAFQLVGDALFVGGSRRGHPKCQSDLARRAVAHPLKPWLSPVPTPP